MGKRWAGAGRRPTLDLGDTMQLRKEDRVAEEPPSEPAPAPAVVNPLLGLMADYSDDDDDAAAGGGGAPTGPAASVEDRVAGFMAELEEHGLVHDGNAAPLPAGGADSENGAALAPAGSAAPAAPAGSAGLAKAELRWRYCLDPKSNAYYYWNIDTNDV